MPRPTGDRPSSGRDCAGTSTTAASIRVGQDLTSTFPPAQRGLAVDSRGPGGQPPADERDHGRARRGRGAPRTTRPRPKTDDCSSTNSAASRRRDSHRHGRARVASHRIAPGLVEDVGPRVEAWLRIGAPIADVRLRRLLCAGPHGRRRRVRPERVATRRGLRRVVRRSARSNRPRRGTGRLGRCRGLWRPRRRVSRWTAR